LRKQFHDRRYGGLVALDEKELNTRSCDGDIKMLIEDVSNVEGFGLEQDWLP